MKQGTTTCIHGTPTDERCEICSPTPPIPGAEENGPRQYHSESFLNLKAWVGWVLKNPLDEHQEAHARATNDLFALLGTRDHQIAAANAERDRLQRMIDVYEEVGEEEQGKIVALEAEREELKGKLQANLDDRTRMQSVINKFEEDSYSTISVLESARDKYKKALEEIAQPDVSDWADAAWLVSWRNQTKELARAALAPRAGGTG